MGKHKQRVFPSQHTTQQQLLPAPAGSNRLALRKNATTLAILTKSKSQKGLNAL